MFTPEQNPDHSDKMSEFFFKCLDDEGIFTHTILNAYQCLIDFSPNLEVAVFPTSEKDTYEIEVINYNSRADHYYNDMSVLTSEEVLAMVPDQKYPLNWREEYDKECKKCFENQFPIFVLSIGNDYNNGNDDVIIAAHTKCTSVNDMTNFVRRTLERVLNSKVAQN